MRIYGTSRAVRLRKDFDYNYQVCEKYKQCITTDVHTFTHTVINGEWN